MIMGKKSLVNQEQIHQATAPPAENEQFLQNKAMADFENGVYPATWPFKLDMHHSFLNSQPWNVVWDDYVTKYTLFKCDTTEHDIINT